MKKGFTLIELLSVVVILSVISVIAYPKIIDVIATTKINAYNIAKSNIIESAKIKYAADVNSSKIVEYSVDDLISEGYLKNDIKNPITNKKYENTKILITNKDGKVSFKYISGDTLSDIVKSLDESYGLYKENDSYVYRGLDVNNYISLNGEIYRLLKIDDYMNAYLLKEDNYLVKKENIDNFINSYYNDNYSQIIKENISSLNLLNYDDYKDSFILNESYIENNDNVWVKNGKEIKALSYLTNELIDADEANIRLVLKLKNSMTILRGNGTQLDPYILGE